MDLDARRVTRRGGEELQLGKLSFDLLQALIQASPAALSTEDIIEKVWSGSSVTDENVQQRVSLLRRALSEGTDQEYIETLRGFGYRLGCAPFPLESESVEVSKTTNGKFLPFRIIVVTLVIVVLLMGIAALALSLRNLKRVGEKENHSIPWSRASSLLERSHLWDLEARLPGDSLSDSTKKNC